MTRITGHGGTGLPNLETFGFGRSWKPAQKLIEEQGKLWQRQKELGREQQHLEAEIRRLKSERVADRATALRTGKPAPTNEAVEAAEAQLQAVEEERAVLMLALERTRADLLVAVRSHREEWDAEVQAAGSRVLEEAQEIANALGAKLHQAEALGALHSWLESGGESFGVGGGAAVSIEALVHERRRALGLIRDEVEEVIM